MNKSRKCFNCGLQIGILEKQHCVCIAESFRNTNIINERIQLVLSNPEKYKFKKRADPMFDPEFAFADKEKGKAIWIARMVVCDFFSDLLMLYRCKDIRDGSMGIYDFCEIVVETMAFINHKFELDIEMERVVAHFSVCCGIRKRCPLDNVHWKVPGSKSEDFVEKREFQKKMAAIIHMVQKSIGNESEQSGLSGQQQEFNDNVSDDEIMRDMDVAPDHLHRTRGHGNDKSDKREMDESE